MSRLKPTPFVNCFRILMCLLVAAAWAAPGRSDPGDTELKDEAGKTIIQYIPEVPSGLAPAGTTDPTRQVGLILVFPEHQHPTGDELKTVRESLERLKFTGQYVLIAAHAQDARGFFGQADHQPLEKLLAWAKQTYPVNPRRVYMFGRGEGAHISGEFSVFHPSLIAAVTTYSWGWRSNPAEIHDPAGTFPEFYTNLGQKEIPTHLAEVRATYARAKARGYGIIFREWPGLGASTLNPPSNDDALAWMTRMRNKNIPPSAEEAALLERAGAHVTDATAEDFQAIALVGGVPAGAVLQKLLDSPSEAVRVQAAKTCADGIFGEATVSALARKLSDPSPAVRQAAIDSLAVLANWRSVAAQRALIGLATAPDSSANHADRLRAVEGLGHAVKLQAAGVQLDPPMFKALATLLDDPDEKIRAASFAILAPIRSSDYKPEASKEERAAAVKAWQQWVTDITVKEDSIPGPSR
jgi:hypothetical protein